MEKLTRNSEVEYKGTIFNGLVIVERSIDEWKEKMEQLIKLHS